MDTSCARPQRTEIYEKTWEYKVPGKDNKHIKYKNPVDYINPAKKPARTNYPLTYLYIRWKIEGKYYYT